MSYSSEYSIAAVVLAGGFGTRVRHLLPGVPKPMAPVAGRPFLEYVLLYLRGHGISQIAISTGHQAEIVASHFHSDRIGSADVRCIAEPFALGTAGGFLNAARNSGFLPDAWMVVNGDSLVLADLTRFQRDFQKGNWDGALLGLNADDASRYGTLETNERSELRRFAEKRPGCGLVNAGVYLFRKQLLSIFPNRTPSSFEVDVFPALLQAERKLFVEAVDVPFLDIGIPETLADAESFIRHNQDRFNGNSRPTLNL